MPLDDRDRHRINDIARDWIIKLSAQLNTDYPDDWGEDFGIILGTAWGHALASAAHGFIAERIRFTEGFNSMSGGRWTLRHVDPERGE